MAYYSVTLPSGIRFSILPPSTDYSANAECDVYRWARTGKNGNRLRSSGLKPLNDKDRYAEAAKRGKKRKAKELKANG